MLGQFVLFEIERLTCVDLNFGRLKLVPLNSTVSRKVISFSDISAVNLMAG